MLLLKYIKMMRVQEDDLHHNTRQENQILHSFITSRICVGRLAFIPSKIKLIMRSWSDLETDSLLFTSSQENESIYCFSDSFLVSYSHRQTSKSDSRVCFFSLLMGMNHNLMYSSSASFNTCFSLFMWDPTVNHSFMYTDLRVNDQWF